jgi:hypothetical protein
VKEIVATSGSIPASPTIVTLTSGFNSYGVAVDGSGNVFVTDRSSNSVKEILAVSGSIPASPTIVTLAGGFQQVFDVALDSNGNVFFADGSPGNAVKEIVMRGVDYGSVSVATTTPVTKTLAFTFDTAGTIGGPAVLTQGAAGLDFVDAGTGTCTTNGAAHNYSVGETCTVDVTFTPRFPGVRQGAAVLKNAGGNAIATAYVFGTGVGPQVGFKTPSAASVITAPAMASGTPVQVALDGLGNMYASVFGTATNQVVKIPAGGGAGTVVNTGSVTLGGGVTGVAVDGGGNLFLCDYNNNRIVVVSANGVVGALNTTGVGLGGMFALAFDGAGNLYAADYGGSRVLKIQITSASLGTASPQGTVSVVNAGGYVFGGVGSVSGVAVDGAGNVYATDKANNTVVKITPSGTAAPIAVNGVGGLNQPTGVALDAAGDIYIVGFDGRIIEVAPNGSAVVIATPGVTSFAAYGVTVDPAGNVLVPDGTTASQLIRIDRTTAPALNFATTNVGSTSAVQTVVIENNGNADLSFPIPGSGNNPSISNGFQLNSTSSGTCPLTGSGSSTAGVVAAGTNCTLPVTFAPTAAGTVNGSLVLTDNNLNVSPSTTQTIALHGTAVLQLTATTVVASTVLTVNRAATPFTPVMGAGGTSPLTYSVTPALPAGLSFNAGTGAVSGTPTVVSAATTYTVTVTDANSVTATASFSLKVNSPVTATVAVADVSLPATHPALTVTPVTGAGGTAPLTYSVSPALPAGLSTNAGTGAISGTTANVSSAATYTVTVTDANGAMASASFRLSVVAVAPTINFTVPGHTYGDALFAVSATSNSAGALTYSVLSGSATVAGNLVTLTGGGAITLQASVAAAGNYLAGTTSANFNVAVTALTVTVNNATRYYGAANPSFTASVTGAKYGDTFTEVFTTTATTTSPVGTYTVVPTVVGANLNNYSVSTNNGTLTVTKAPTTTALTLSNTSVNANQTLTLTATVVSTTSGTPTGTVVFSDNGTVIQTATLANGVAAYGATLAPGSHTITVAYSGDANFLASAGAGTGATVTVPPLDFTLSGLTSPQEIMASETASFDYKVAPMYGSYPGTVTLTISGLPTNATATFSQNNLAANAGTQTITVKIQTAAVAKASRRDASPPWSLALLLLPLAGASRMRRSSQVLRKRLMTLVVVVGATAALAGMTGCGLGILRQPAKDYSVTVTATSGAVRHSTVATLTVW